MGTSRGRASQIDRRPPAGQTSYDPPQSRESESASARGRTTQWCPKGQEHRLVRLCPLHLTLPGLMDTAGAGEYSRRRPSMPVGFISRFTKSNHELRW
jgi:hypothetical protein